MCCERGNNVALWSVEEGRALQDPDLPTQGTFRPELLNYNPAAVPLG